MADAPVPELSFAESCDDCGQRTIVPPRQLPAIGDDFDWLLRDYDGFRLFMLEELAGRFPERARWTPADIEVIFAEALAVVLDQLSDALDRVQAEAFLDSARRPANVHRLLRLIGYDSVRHHHKLSWADEKLVIHLLAFQGLPVETLEFAPVLTISENIARMLDWLGELPGALGVDPDLADRDTERDFLHLLGYEVDSLREALDLEIPAHRQFATNELEHTWLNNVHAMNQARLAGPQAVHTNRRMVTLVDYAERVEDHPIALRAAGSSRWTGSWSTVEVVVVLAENAELDTVIDDVLAGDALTVMQNRVDDFHWHNELPSVDWHLHPTFRSVLSAYIGEQRMVGQEVWLQDAQPVGINVNLAIRVADNYFQSEVRNATSAAMGTEPGGYFEPGMLAFGQDLFASDLIEWLMRLDGVESVCLNRFKRVGARYPDESGSGVIKLRGTEIGRCDNRLGEPAFGYWRLTLHGGQRG